MMMTEQWSECRDIHLVHKLAYIGSCTNISDTVALDDIHDNSKIEWVSARYKLLRYSCTLCSFRLLVAFFCLSCLNFALISVFGGIKNVDWEFQKYGSFQDCRHSHV